MSVAAVCLNSLGEIVGVGTLGAILGVAFAAWRQTEIERGTDTAAWLDQEDGLTRLRG